MEPGGADDGVRKCGWMQTKEDDTELHFEYVFTSAATVYFAYSFPFSYQECENMLKHLNK